MEKLFMSAGIVVTIVLCLIGLVKLPFKNFKHKHPTGYKALFTSISFVFALGLSVLDELFVLQGQLLSVDFLILVCAVLAGVFGGYNGVYEGLGTKELMKKLAENAKKAKELSNDKNVVKTLSKIEDIDKAIALLEQRKNQNSEV